MTAVLTELPVSPYKGLANYTEQDAALFFGRDREREIIIANLKARRLTLLYGGSGVGKSSLLRAGVVADLADAARRNLADIATPEHVPVIFSAWSDEPVAGLAAAITTAVHTFAEEQGEPPDSGSLADVISWAADCADAYLLLILDQFEEYFLYHATDKAAGTFATELPDILNRPGVQANVLISIREDALAKLDFFKRDVPRLFDSSLRINHLDTAAARQAIQRPLERYNALAPLDEQVMLEAGLVDAVIDQVSSGRVVLEQTGHGTLEHSDGRDDDATDRIETPYLQLVLARLWTLAMDRGDRRLTRAALDELGGAERIVSHHLDEALAALGPNRERLAAELFAFLITPSKTKIAQAPSDLAYWTHRPLGEVTGVLRELAVGERRILRSVPPPLGDVSGVERYEIFHDVLAEPISEWRSAHEQVREREALAARLEEERRGRAVAERRRRRAIGAALGAIVLAAVAVLALVVALHERSTARAQRATAEAAAFASASFDNLDSDPELSLLLAVQALRARETPVAEQALRQAVGASRIRAVLRGRASRPCPACRVRGDARAAPASIAIGPTGLVAAGIGSRTVVWDPVSGRTRSVGPTWLPHTSTVSFSPDGRHMLAGAVNAFGLVSGVTGAARAVPVRGVGAAIFSPDGRAVVTGRRDGITIRDRRTLRVVRRLRIRTPEGGPAIAFGGPRNATLAATTATGVALWRWPARGAPDVVLTGRRAFDLGSLAPAPAVAVSPDGRTVAAVGPDGNASVWRIGSRRLLLTTSTGVGPGQAAPLAFTPDSRRVLIIGDKTAILWRLGSPPSPRVLSGHFDNILAAALSPDGALVATASADSTIRLWEAATGQLLTVLHGHEGDVTGVAFSADGRMLASRGSDRTLRLWNVTSGRVLRDAAGKIYDARFSPEGRWIATGGEDGIAHLYDVGGVARRTVAKTDGNIFAVSFGRDGRVLAAGNTEQLDGFLAVTDTATGRSMVARPRSTGPLVSATFLPDGRRVVTGDGSGTVRLWSISGGRLRLGRELLRLGIGPADKPLSLRADGNLIAVAAGNGTVHLVRDDGTPVRVLHTGSGGDEAVYAASFSPDARRLVTAGLHQPIRVWSVRDGKPLVTISGVPGTTFGAEFSPDGRRLVTAGVDGAVRLWDAATGRPVAVLDEHADAVTPVSFSPDGRSILSAGDDRTARLYPCEPCAPVPTLLALARARTSRDLTPAELQRYSGGS